MRKDASVRLLVVMLAALTLLLIGERQVGAQEKPVVRFYLFYGETCPHCHEVIDNYLPQVYEKYGDQVEHTYLEVWSDTDNYLTLLGLEQKLGVPEDRRGAVPALVIGDHVLIGAVEIPEQLEPLIDAYLAQGGVDYPSLEDLPEVILPTQAPAVQLLVVFDPNQADFAALRDFIASLGETHQGSLQVYSLDVSQSGSTDVLARLNAALGIASPPPGTPQALIDRRMLVGLDEIERELPGLVDVYLAQGGVALPSLEELEGSATPVPTPVPTPTSEPKPIYIAYFSNAGCQGCARTDNDLHVVEEQYPQVVVERFPKEEKENVLLNQCLAERYNVPEEKRQSTPMLFIGEDVLIGSEADLNKLLTVVDKYVATGAEPTWNDCDLNQVERVIIDDFNRWDVLVILVAGLVDGLNPCAFATLVFFISYLTFTGRRGRDILLVGAAFAVGVFLTYFLVGLGLLKAIQSLEFFPLLGRWVYLLTALLCTVLAVFTFRDFFRARQGRASEMTLSLPDGLRRRINRVIRENARVEAFVAVALVTGFVVSLLELTCTGQVYFPTIAYVTTVPELASRAVFYLLLYCLMFIVPLVVVFLLSYFGATSEQLGLFLARHVVTIKMLTALVFVGLALWMTWTLAPLFEIAVPWNWVLMGGVVFVVGAGAALLRRADASTAQSAQGRAKKRKQARG
jgi:cytochrome c biogenesis protein CcdA/thiol-disulfide isomerase/thioredoxin/glutaredoxin